MIVKELFGTQIINASFLFANSNISVKYYSKDFPSVRRISNFELRIHFKIKNLNFYFRQSKKIKISYSNNKIKKNKYFLKNLLILAKFEPYKASFSLKYIIYKAL
jgi:hypothetical protein